MGIWVIFLVLPWVLMGITWVGMTIGVCILGILLNLIDYVKRKQELKRKGSRL